MLFFGLSVAAGVAALLTARKLDIECENPVELKRSAPRRKAAAQRPVSTHMLPGAVYLQQQ